MEENPWCLFPGSFEVLDYFKIIFFKIVYTLLDNNIIVSQFNNFYNTIQL